MTPRDSVQRIRLVLWSCLGGYSQSEIVEMLACRAKPVTRVQQRFREHGVEGLWDRRGDNGTAKVTDDYVLALIEDVRGSPQDHGYPRPTWTLELLVKVLAEQTGIRISVGTMSRLLRRLGIRRGMRKPTVGCPWSPRSRKRLLGLIHKLIETLPADQVAVWEDEIDIHLNPKIGPDYMLPGEQKTVRTPGKNVKDYVAGAMDAGSEPIIWVEAKRKNSVWFIALLKKLAHVYAEQKVIGLGHLTCPKDLRHLFATSLQAAGVDPMVRRDIMGHTSLEMTAHYTHTQNRTRQRELGRLTEIRGGVLELAHDRV